MVIIHLAHLRQSFATMSLFVIVLARQEMRGERRFDENVESGNPLLTLTGNPSPNRFGGFDIGSRTELQKENGEKSHSLMCPRRGARDVEGLTTSCYTPLASLLYCSRQVLLFVRILPSPECRLEEEGRYSKGLFRSISEHVWWRVKDQTIGIATVTPLNCSDESHGVTSYGIDDV